MVSVNETKRVVGERGAGAGASWSSLFVGAVIALGVMLVLSLLGLAVGFTVIDPLHDADPLAGIGIGAAIYFVFVHLVALGLGGYAAARLAGSSWTSRALLHGGTVWALVSVFILVSATTGVGYVVSGAVTAVSTITGGAAQAAEGMIPDDMEMPDFRDVENLIPDDFIETLPPDVQSSLQEQNVSAQQLRQAGGEAISEVITEENQQQAQQALTETVTNIVRNPGQAGAEIEQFSEQVLGSNGLITEQDRSQAAGVLQTRLGISQNEAESVLEQWQENVQQQVSGFEGELENIQMQATEVAQQATDAISTAAWYAFIISVLGLIAALLGSWLGRPSMLAVDRI